MQVHALSKKGLPKDVTLNEVEQHAQHRHSTLLDAGHSTVEATRMVRQEFGIRCSVEFYRDWLNDGVDLDAGFEES